MKAAPLLPSSYVLNKSDSLEPLTKRDIVFPVKAGIQGALFSVPAHAGTTAFTQGVPFCQTSE